MFLFSPRKEPTPESSESEDEECATSRRKVIAGVTTRAVFDEAQCSAIEAKIEEVVFNATNSDLKPLTVEKGPLLTR